MKAAFREPEPLIALTADTPQGVAGGRIASQKKRSSSPFVRLAQKFDLDAGEDESFNRFLNVHREWFAA